MNENEGKHISKLLPSRGYPSKTLSAKGGKKAPSVFAFEIDSLSKILLLSSDMYAYMCSRIFLQRNLNLGEMGI